MSNVNHHHHLPHSMPSTSAAAAAAAAAAVATAAATRTNEPVRNSASLKRKVPNGLPDSMREIHEHFLW